MQDDSQLAIGTPCSGCGTTLTPENLAYTTPKGQKVGPVGVCKACAGLRSPVETPHPQQ